MTTEKDKIIATAQKLTLIFQEATKRLAKVAPHLRHKTNILKDLFAEHGWKLPYIHDFHIPSYNTAYFYVQDIETSQKINLGFDVEHVCRENLSNLPEALEEIKTAHNKFLEAFDIFSQAKYSALEVISYDDYFLTIHSTANQRGFDFIYIDNLAETLDHQNRAWNSVINREILFLPYAQRAKFAVKSIVQKKSENLNQLNTYILNRKAALNFKRQAKFFKKSSANITAQLQKKVLLVDSFIMSSLRSSQLSILKNQFAKS